MRRKILRWTVVALLTTVIIAPVNYFADMNRAHMRIDGKSTVMSSPYGDIEFLEGGSGPPVLVIHGSGGGYDQGQLVAEAALGNQFRWIAPSRFGYLRSGFRADATWDDQAQANEKGRHFLIGVEQLKIREDLTDHILSHTGSTARLRDTMAL